MSYSCLKHFRGCLYEVWSLHFVWKGHDYFSFQSIYLTFSCFLCSGCNFLSFPQKSCVFLLPHKLTGCFPFGAYLLFIFSCLSNHYCPFSSHISHLTEILIHQEVRAFMHVWKEFPDSNLVKRLSYMFPCLIS